MNKIRNAFIEERTNKTTKGGFAQRIFTNFPLNPRSKQDADLVPNVSLKIKHIYGGSSHLVNSLYYSHFHINEDESLVCERKICYFVSKYAVVFSPCTSEQRLYSFHDFKISCMDVNMKDAVATTASHSQVHIWSILSLMLLQKVESRLSRIHLLRLSSNKNLIVIGVLENDYVLELYKWK